MALHFERQFGPTVHRGWDGEVRDHLRPCSYPGVGGVVEHHILGGIAVVLDLDTELDDSLVRVDHAEQVASVRAVRLERDDHGELIVERLTEIEGGGCPDVGGAADLEGRVAVHPGGVGDPGVVVRGDADGAE